MGFPAFVVKYLTIGTILVHYAFADSTPEPRLLEGFPEPRGPRPRAPVLVRRMFRMDKEEQTKGQRYFEQRKGLDASIDKLAREASGGRLNGEELRELYKANPQLVQHRLLTNTEHFKQMWPRVMPGRAAPHVPGAVPSNEWSVFAMKTGHYHYFDDIEQHKKMPSKARTQQLEHLMGPWTREETEANHKWHGEEKNKALAKAMGVKKIGQPEPEPESELINVFRPPHEDEPSARFRPPDHEPLHGPWNPTRRPPPKRNFHSVLPRYYHSTKEEEVKKEEEAKKKRGKVDGPRQPFACGTDQQQATNVPFAWRRSTSGTCTAKNAAIRSTRRAFVRYFM